MGSIGNEPVVETSIGDDVVQRCSCMQRFDPESEVVRDDLVPWTNIPFPNSHPDAPSLTIDMRFTWETGTNLKVKFLDQPSAVVGNKIKQYALAWTAVANINFTFVTSGDADIRIALKRGDGSWSYVGKQAQTAVPDQTMPTMNFGWFTDITPDSEFSRTTIHEFGHAIGAVHEQFNPNLHITWIPDAVIAYFKKPDNGGWPEATTRLNFNNFVQISGASIKATGFDGKSIMCHPIHSDWNQEHISVVQSTTLSDMDKSWIAAIYPK